MIGSGEARPIVVVGAGGHAKVIVDCLRQSGWIIVGCTDSDSSPRLCAGVPVIGTDELLGELQATGVRHAFCALGDNALRERIGNDLLSLGFEIPAISAPGSIISPSAVIGMGVAILPGAVVNVDTTIGDFAIVNTNANIDHDCIIGRAAHIGPGAALAGEIEIGDRAFVATGCVVIPRRRIGADTLVGAGSVVVRDLPSGVVAHGNPARVRGP